MIIIIERAMARDDHHRLISKHSPFPLKRFNRDGTKLDALDRSPRLTPRLQSGFVKNPLVRTRQQNLLLRSARQVTAP